MEETVNLRFIYGGKTYDLIIKTLKFTDKFIICKIQIGFSHNWIICQRGRWLFIGDITLCNKLQQTIICNIAKLEVFNYLADLVNLNVESSSKRDLIASAILNKLIKVNRSS